MTSIFLQKNEGLRKNRGLILIFLILTAVLACAARYLSHPSVPDHLGVVKRADFIQRVTVAGTVIPRRRTIITAPYVGYIKKLYVHVGSHVNAGDPVVSVVQTLTGVDEKVYPLRAPFSGTVVQVLHTDGEYVDMGDSNVIVRIDDLSGLMVQADAPEMDVVKIKEGQDVIVKVSATVVRSYKGIIREIFRAAREKKDWNRTLDKVDFPIRIDVTDPDEMIKPGMTALVDVIANKHDKALLLRHEYVQRTGEQYFVTLKTGEKRNIQVGLQNEEFFEIAAGIAEGDQVRQTDFLSQPEDL